MSTGSIFMAIKGINVCIYGLNRSLGVTVHSIKEKILQPVASIADEVHFYAAYNVTCSGYFSSQRRGERSSRNGNDKRTCCLTSGSSLLIKMISMLI